MHDNRHVRSPVIITTTLYGTCMTHVFIRVCALIYNGVSPSTFAHHLGHQYLLQTAEVIPRLLTPLPLCSHHQAEACCRAQTVWAAWRVDGTSALTSANRTAPGHARKGMRDHSGPRPDAGTQLGSSMQGDSCRSVQCKSIPQLGHVAPGVQMRPLPAEAAWQRGTEAQ